MDTEIYIRLAKIREFIVSRCMKKVIVLDKDNNIIDNKFIIFFVNLFYYINLKHLLKFFNINTLYKLDNLHYYDTNINQQIKINSIITSFKIDNIDITDIIKKYSLEVPIRHLLFIEKFLSSNKIYINMLKLFKLQSIEYDIQNVIDKKIYELL